MRMLIVPTLLAACAAPPEAVVLVEPRLDTAAALQPTCWPTSDFTFLVANPYEHEERVFDGAFNLEFISAPTSAFYARGPAFGHWAMTVELTSPEYGVPIVEEHALGFIPGAYISYYTTWPAGGDNDTGVDLCTATFTLRMTLTELDGYGEPLLDGACTSEHSVDFLLNPSEPASRFCPLRLVSEERLERSRAR